ncbi:hypothetical protein ACFQVA_10765 [Actinomadura keratinilytica]
MRRPARRSPRSRSKGSWPSRPALSARRDVRGPGRPPRRSAAPRGRDRPPGRGVAGQGLLQAEVLSLLKLNVGADVELSGVELDIKGVDAQALLNVRLDNVAAIIGRVLATIDRNPQILEQITSGLGATAENLGEGAGKAVGELGEGAGEAVEETGKGARKAVEGVGEGAGKAAEEVGGSAGEAVEEAGGAASDVASEAGDTVSEAGDKAGDTASEAAGSAGRTARRTAEAAPPGVPRPGVRGTKAGTGASGSRARASRRRPAGTGGRSHPETPPRTSRPPPGWRPTGRRPARTGATARSLTRPGTGTRMCTACACICRRTRSVDERSVLGRRRPRQGQFEPLVARRESEPGVEAVRVHAPLVDRLALPGRQGEHRRQFGPGRGARRQRGRRGGGGCGSLGGAYHATDRSRCPGRLAAPRHPLARPSPQIRRVPEAPPTPPGRPEGGGKVSRVLLSR